MIALNQPPEASDSGKRFTWRLVYVWYALALVACVIGAILHDQILATEAWKRWAETKFIPGPHPSRLTTDLLRSFLGLMAALYALAQLDVISPKDDRDTDGMTLNRIDVALVSIAVTAVLFVSLETLPVHLYLEIVALAKAHSLTLPEPFAYADLWRSYLYYTPYVIGLWFGMAFPVLFFLSRSISADFRSWSASGKEDNGNPAMSEAALIVIVERWYTRRRILRLVARHYVSVVAPIVALMLVEVLVFRYSTAALAVELGFIALSLIPLPSMAMLLVVFFVLYRRELEKTERRLGEFLARCRDAEATALCDRANRELRELEGQSEFDFFVSVLKSRNCFIFICVSGASIVANLAAFLHIIRIG